jgi:hypothetical protein
MDKLSLYRQYIQELLTQRAKLRSPSDPECYQKQLR